MEYARVSDQDVEGEGLLAGGPVSDFGEEDLRETYVRNKNWPVCKVRPLSLSTPRHASTNPKSPQNRLYTTFVVRSYARAACLLPPLLGSKGPALCHLLSLLGQPSKRQN
jgi:hypothetical protein